MSFLQNYRLPIILTFILFALVPIAAKFGHGYTAITAIVAFYYSAYFLSVSDKNYNLKHWAVVCIPFIIPYFFTSDYPRLQIFLPIIIFTMISAYFIFIRSYNYKENLYKYLFYLLVPFLVVVWVAQENWAAFMFMQTNPVIKKQIPFVLKNNKNELLKTNPDNYNYYYFWTSNCRNCKENFPRFIELSDKVKDRDDVDFYIVFIKFGLMDTVAYQRFAKDNSNVNWLIAENSKEVWETYLKGGVPQMIIQGPGNELLYNGYVFIRPWIFVKRPLSFIKKGELGY